MTMRRSSRDQKGTAVKVSEFKVHLGRYLKEVKAGHEITVLDRATPVAKLVPISKDLEEDIQAVPPVLSWIEMHNKWLTLATTESATVLKKSTLEYLSEDRE